MRIVVCLILAGAAAGWAAARPTGAAPAKPPADPGRPYGVGAVDGAPSAALSCSAASCHGGGQPGRAGSEHSTWAVDLSAAAGDPHDPHARAYRVLFAPASRRMAELLEPDEAKRTAPHENEACLKCHGVAGVADKTARAEGVGCAGCHGPDERWRTVHYLSWWKALSNREKAGYGFVPTKNLVARASACAACHVGGADRDVDHDLIAAGHPRLAFEYTRFHYQPAYRKHWAEKTPQPDFEVRAWAVGQVASLRAAADLLRVRAERAAGGGVWPEFAGYSCYACHQSVGGDGPKAGASATTRRGRPGWEVWYTAAAPAAMTALGELYPGLPAAPEAELTALRARMGRGGAGRKDRPDAPGAVAAGAAKLVAKLDAWLAAVQAAEDGAADSRLTRDQGRRLVADLAAFAAASESATPTDHDWDSLAARFLGCAAVHHATGGAAANPAWAGPLDDIRAGLRFPDPSFDSPAGFDRHKLKSVRGRFDGLRIGGRVPGGE